MSPHSPVLELPEATAALCRLTRRALDSAQGRGCFVHAEHVAARGHVGLGVVVTVEGTVIATLSTCLPLSTTGEHRLAAAVRAALTAIAMGVTPTWARLGVNFEPERRAHELRALPDELAAWTERRAVARTGHAHERARHRQLGLALAGHGASLRPWAAQITARSARAQDVSRPPAVAEGQGLHLYVDGSADERGNLGWACIWVQGGEVVDVRTGGRTGWRRDFGCDGATAAEREAVWLALDELRARQLAAVVHSDRIDLQRMADSEHGVSMTLTPDHNHIHMRAAHNASRAARVDVSHGAAPRNAAD